MNISELIAKLELIKERHGDIEVIGYRKSLFEIYNTYFTLETFFQIEKSRLHIIFRKMTRKEFNKKFKGK